MTAVNTIVYPNALIINGISYDLKIKTPDAQMQADAAKITEIFKAVLCTHFGKEAEKLTIREITTKVEYTPDEGAKIGGDKSVKPITKVFLDTFQGDDYKGLKVAGPAPTVADAIEDIYNIQTSAKVAGDVNPLQAGWGTRAYNGTSAVFNGIGRAIKGGASWLFGWKDLEAKIAKPDNLAHIKEICNEMVNNEKKSKKKKSAAAEKRYNDALDFYNKHILPFIQQKLKRANAPETQENLKLGFLNVLTIANKYLKKQNQDLIGLRRVTKAMESWDF